MLFFKSLPSIDSDFPNFQCCYFRIYVFLSSIAADGIFSRECLNWRVAAHVLNILA